MVWVVCVGRWVGVHVWVSVCLSFVCFCVSCVKVTLGAVGYCLCYDILRVCINHRTNS